MLRLLKKNGFENKQFFSHSAKNSYFFLKTGIFSSIPLPANKTIFLGMFGERLQWTNQPTYEVQQAQFLLKKLLLYVVNQDWLDHYAKHFSKILDIQQNYVQQDHSDWKFAIGYVLLLYVKLKLCLPP